MSVRPGSRPLTDSLTFFHLPITPRPLTGDSREAYKKAAGKETKLRFCLQLVAVHLSPSRPVVRLVRRPPCLAEIARYLSTINVAILSDECLADPKYDHHRTGFDRSTGRTIKGRNCVQDSNAEGNVPRKPLHRQYTCLLYTSRCVDRKSVV